MWSFFLIQFWFKTRDKFFLLCFELLLLLALVFFKPVLKIFLNNPNLLLLQRFRLKRHLLALYFLFDFRSLSNLTLLLSLPDVQSINNIRFLFYFVYAGFLVCLRLKCQVFLYIPFFLLLLELSLLVKLFLPFAQDQVCSVLN